LRTADLMTSSADLLTSSDPKHDKIIEPMMEEQG
jgi:hypothetical protein